MYGSLVQGSSCFSELAVMVLKMSTICAWTGEGGTASLNQSSIFALSPVQAVAVFVAF